MWSTRTLTAFTAIGATKNTTFTDDNITEDSSDGPQEAINPFDQSDSYPRAVTLHEQRLTFASLASDPQAVFLSQSTILENFGAASPAKADDAIVQGSVEGTAVYLFWCPRRPVLPCSRRPLNGWWRAVVTKTT